MSRLDRRRIGQPWCQLCDRTGFVPTTDIINGKEERTVKPCECVKQKEPSSTPPSRPSPSGPDFKSRAAGE